MFNQDIQPREVFNKINNSSHVLGGNFPLLWVSSVVEGDFGEEETMVQVVLGAVGQDVSPSVPII